MSKSRLDERGLTLVELLAVIAIAALIIIFASSLIIQAMKNQERITAEVHLRDEADIMMSGLIREIFALKESEINKVECGTLTNGVATPVSCITERGSLSAEQVAQVAAAKAAMELCQHAGNCNSYALVYLHDGQTIGFLGQTLFLRGQQYDIASTSIQLSPYYTLELKESSQHKKSIIVAFQLSNETKKIVQSFQNEIVIVNNEM